MPSTPTTAPLGTLVRGTVSPVLPVPASIPRPEYAWKKAPEKYTGSNVLSPEKIEKVRAAGKIAAQAIVEVGTHIRPGVTTEETLGRGGHCH